MLKVLSGLQALVEENDVRREREATARWIWSGGAEPVPAESPQWREDSLGGRFFGGFFLSEARKAPCLATAEIPDATVIAAHPGHWKVATNALVRAGAVPPRDILPVGLRLLSALAQLCRSNSPSLLQPAA